MSWPVLIPLGLGIVVLFEVAFHLFFGRMCLAYFEDCPPFQVPAKSPLPEAERIEFPNGAGQTLRGAIQSAGDRQPRGLLIFSPEMKADFWSYQAYVPAAQLAGFDILAFNVRNQGASDSEPGYQPLHWLSGKEVQDLDAAVSYARSRPEYRNVPIVLHGVSRGAGAAIAVATSRSDIGGVVTQGAFSCWGLLDYYMKKWKRAVIPRLQYVIPDWHNRITMAVTKRLSERRRGARYISIEPSLPRLRSLPLLWMAAERDSCVPLEVADSLFARTGHPEEDLWVVPKARHNGERVAQHFEFDRRLVGFLSGVVATPAATSEGQSDSATTYSALRA